MNVRERKQHRCSNGGNDSSNLENKNTINRWDKVLLEQNQQLNELIKVNPEAKEQIATIESNIDKIKIFAEYANKIVKEYHLEDLKPLPRVLEKTITLLADAQRHFKKTVDAKKDTRKIEAECRELANLLTDNIHSFRRFKAKQEKFDSLTQKGLKLSFKLNHYQRKLFSIQENQNENEFDELRAAASLFP